MKQRICLNKNLGYFAAAVIAAWPAVAGLGAATRQERTPLAPERITAELVQQGAGLFAEGTCTRCHGRGGGGGRQGPDLTDGVWLHSDGAPEGIRATIVRGVPEEALKDGAYRQEMPPMGNMMLDDAQLDALAAYVWSLSR